MPLADIFGDNYQEDQEYVCISFCHDCAKPTTISMGLCTEEQSLNGTKVSTHAAIQIDFLEQYEIAFDADDYVNPGFSSCGTDDCNMADVCISTTASTGNSSPLLTKCWDSSSGGVSMPLATTFGYDYQQDDEYVCISFCYNCATPSIDSMELCTSQQSLNGTKVSIHTTVANASVEYKDVMYAIGDDSSGFASCSTDDCNRADACAAVGENSYGTAESSSFTSSGEMGTVTNTTPATTLIGGENHSDYSNETMVTTFQSLGDGDLSVNSTPYTLSTFDVLSASYTMSLSIESPLMPSLSRFGDSVAISGDGSLVAVGGREATTGVTRDTTGAVYLYSVGTEADANSLSLLQVLYGQSSSDEYGNAIALSLDGNRLVVGSRSENGHTGAMRIYQRNDGMAAGAATAAVSWSLMEGGLVSGQNPSERAGWSVSISADGNVAAMGSPKGGSYGGGSILAFKYNNFSSGWDPYGSIIEGLSSGVESGYSISLSESGSTMAVGSPKASNLDGLRNAGKTTVYSMSRSSWQMLGQELHGEAESDANGASVAMSQNGTIVVIGGKGRSEFNGTTGQVILQSTGHCNVYQIQAGQWEFQHSMVGKTSEERLGSSVAVSANGNIVACGGVSGVRDGHSTKSGVVRLWNRATLQESTIWPRGEDVDVAGATFGTSLALSARGECAIVGAPTWSDEIEGRTSSSSGTVQMFRLNL